MPSLASQSLRAVMPEQYSFEEFDTLERLDGVDSEEELLGIEPEMPPTPPPPPPQQQQQQQQPCKSLQMLSHASVQILIERAYTGMPPAISPAMSPDLLAALRGGELLIKPQIASKISLPSAQMTHSAASAVLLHYPSPVNRPFAQPMDVFNQNFPPVGNSSLSLCPGSTFQYQPMQGLMNSLQSQDRQVSQLQQGVGQEQGNEAFRQDAQGMLAVRQDRERWSLKMQQLQSRKRAYTAFKAAQKELDISNPPIIPEKESKRDFKMAEQPPDARTQRLAERTRQAALRTVGKTSPSATKSNARTSIQRNNCADPAGDPNKNKRAAALEAAIPQTRQRLARNELYLPVSQLGTMDAPPPTPESTENGRVHAPTIQSDPVKAIRELVQLPTASLYPQPSAFYFALSNISSTSSGSYLSVEQRQLQLQLQQQLTHSMMLPFAAAAPPHTSPVVAADSTRLVKSAHGLLTLLKQQQNRQEEALTAYIASCPDLDGWGVFDLQKQLAAKHNQDWETLKNDSDFKMLMQQEQQRRPYTEQEKLEKQQRDSKRKSLLFLQAARDTLHEAQLLHQHNMLSTDNEQTQKQQQQQSIDYVSFLQDSSQPPSDLLSEKLQLHSNKTKAGQSTASRNQTGGAEPHNLALGTVLALLQRHLHIKKHKQPSIAQQQAAECDPALPPVSSLVLEGAVLPVLSPSSSQGCKRGSQTMDDGQDGEQVNKQSKLTADASPGANSEGNSSAPSDPQPSPVAAEAAKNAGGEGSNRKDTVMQGGDRKQSQARCATIPLFPCKPPDVQLLLSR